MPDEAMLAGRLAAELGLAAGAVARTIALLDEGSTIPFIARYRKEATGGLDEEQLRRLEDRLRYLRSLEERRAQVLRSIDEQGRLTPELAATIRAAETLQTLEDLYLPYRPKRRTRATLARERGLEPLAQMILDQVEVSASLDALAAPYLTPEVPTADEAWAGARDIVAEVVSEDPAVRQHVRTRTRAIATLRVQRAGEEADAGGIYRLYHDFRSPLTALASHQMLAINRGEREGALKVSLAVDAASLVAEIQAAFYRAWRATSRWRSPTATSGCSGRRSSGS